MISPTDDGFSDADIKRIIANRSPDIPNIPDRPLQEPLMPLPEIPRAVSLLPQPRVHNSIIGRGEMLQEQTTKGKEVYRGVEWHTPDRNVSEWECEELAYQLLASLSRSRLAKIQRRILPLLQFDLVGSLPPELSLHILKLLPATALLTCALVCRRWNSLANDQALWRNLCQARGWEWWLQAGSPSPRQSITDISTSASSATREDRDEDEGMGDEEEGEDEGSVVDATGVADVTNEDLDLDPEFTPTNLQAHDFQNLMGQQVSVSSSTAILPISRSTSAATTICRTFSQRHAASTGSQACVPLTPDYKLLHHTQTLLRNRVRNGEYRLRVLPGAEGGGHTAAVYCLALWSYNLPSGPLHVLFTGSKDRTVREWDLSTNRVRRRIVGMHASSVLSLCVTAATVESSSAEPTFRSTDEAGRAHRGSETGLLVSSGSDCRIVIWDLQKFKLVKVLRDHQDSVLCVRTDAGRLVSCSKDRTIRSYAFPSLKQEFVFRGHRAAVNAVSIVGDIIVSGSGDRTVRVWDARTGVLISTFEDHHARATKLGWSTCPEFDNPPAGQPVNPSLTTNEPSATGCSTLVRGPERHSQPVRSVALGDEFAVSGSYDCTIKVWDTKTGALVVDLTNGHTGRIFCVGIDSTKIVSCGEDQRICIWDFSNGINTTFIKL
ncbi:quinon protein alcohol dehydrogenase-like superfamily [Melanogaster broomeanus]|nr:quinon protein alcohol dehydrogenase-like superfamily [Melanogaster broomeanus]